MEYNIQKKLQDILEKLQLKVNQGKYNSVQKEEAVKIITKIRNEYQIEIEEYLKKQKSIDDRDFNADNLIEDQSFMIEYVTTKKDVEGLRHALLFLHKSIIIDDNVRWEDQFLKLVDLFFKREDNKFSKAEFFRQLIYYRFKNDDNNSKYNIDKNYTLREKSFYNNLKTHIVNDPIFISEFFNFDLTANFGFDKKFNEIFNVQNSFLLDLIMTKYGLLKQIPDNYKEHFLVNLFAINENIDAREFLHPSYKNNNKFCELFQ